MIKYVKPLHTVCLRDEDRPNFSLIQVKDNIARATNGSVIVCMNLLQCSKLDPSQVEMLHGKYIHMDVWAKMAKCDEIEIDDETICIIIKGVKHRFEYNEPEDHQDDGKPEWETRKKRWFDLDSIILNIKRNGEDNKRLVGIDSDNIKIVAKAFDLYHLYFSFSPRDLGMVVFPGEDMGMFAIIMPLDSGGVNRYMFES